MALLMEPGAEPTTEDEKADFAAIESIREEAALELKEQGNEFLKKGKKHYSDALDCYTRAIDQKAVNAINNSVLYGNRAQANLLLGNYRRAINDAEDAIKLNPANVKVVSNAVEASNYELSGEVMERCYWLLSLTDLKAYYRGAKSALALKLWPEAAGFCSGGLKHDPSNEELKSLKGEVQQKLAKEAARKKRALETKSRFEALLSAILKRNIRVGKALYKERTGPRKPFLDRSGILHWPVLLLYGEVMFSDLIEDFPETDMFRSHIEIHMFGKDAPPLGWDERNEYTEDRIELYYQANVGPVLSRTQLLNSLMEGEVGLEGLDLNEHVSDGKSNSTISETRDARWVKVDEKMTLHDAVSRRNHILPGVPVFYVVASGTSFREKFLSGHWSAP